jgi:hypothetical protein
MATTRNLAQELRHLEGRRVSAALRDGSRIDDCQLVSAGRTTMESLWLFTNGADAFVRWEDVVDVWEVVVCRAA